MGSIKQGRDTWKDMESIWDDFEALGPNAHLTLKDGLAGGSVVELAGVIGKPKEIPPPEDWAAGLSEYEQSVHEEFIGQLFDHFDPFPLPY